LGFGDNEEFPSMVQELLNERHFDSKPQNPWHVSSLGMVLVSHTVDDSVSWNIDLQYVER